MFGSLRMNLWPPGGSGEGPEQESQDSRRPARFRGGILAHFHGKPATCTGSFLRDSDGYRPPRPSGQVYPAGIVHSPLEARDAPPQTLRPPPPSLAVVFAADPWSAPLGAHNSPAPVLPPSSRRAVLQPFVVSAKGENKNGGGKKVLTWSEEIAIVRLTKISR